MISASVQALRALCLTHSTSIYCDQCRLLNFLIFRVSVRYGLNLCFCQRELTDNDFVDDLENASVVRYRFFEVHQFYQERQQMLQYLLEKGQPQAVINSLSQL